MAMLTTNWLTYKRIDGKVVLGALIQLMHLELLMSPPPLSVWIVSKYGINSTIGQGIPHREDIILGHFNEAALQILC